MDQKNKFLVILASIFIILGTLLIGETQSEGKLRLVFCDVGQGDGILIISSSGKQVVVDGGPGKRILSCLSSKMPFWDRTLDMVIATHAQKDHMEGLFSVFEAYEVFTIVSNGIGGDSGIFREWEKFANLENANYIHPGAGTKFVLGEGEVLTVLWPRGDMLDFWRGNLPSDLNKTSYVMRLDFAGKCAYLTGDIPKEMLVPVVSGPCDILKVSHHGSKTGTNEEVLLKINPKIAVIQVGKNSYGHPTEEVLSLLDKFKVETLRNDLLGTIEITVGNEGYEVFNN